MGASGGDLESAFRMELSADIGEIEVRFRAPRDVLSVRGSEASKLATVTEEIQHLREVGRPSDVQASDDGGLCCVRSGNEEAWDSSFSDSVCDAERPTNRPEGPV